MITVKVDGVQQVAKNLRDIPSVLDAKQLSLDLAAKFSARLYDATPLGFTGRLPRSVLWGADGEEGVVGYSKGVERDGNPELDRRQSVTRWVPADELESVLDGESAAYSQDAVIYSEEYFRRRMADAFS